MLARLLRNCRVLRATGVVLPPRDAVKRHRTGRGLNAIKPHLSRLQRLDLATELAMD